MSLFGAIDTGGTGVAAMQTWLDTSAANIANADDQVPAGSATYAEQIPIFSEIADGTSGGGGDGVSVTVASGSDAGTIVPDPGSQLANAAGEVAQPSYSLSDQLVNLIQAQEGYQADAAAIAKAQTAYQAGLGIGS